jgi:UPF0716 protein FxsA
MGSGERAHMSVRGRAGCLLVIAYPIVEIAIAILVAQVIGWWWLLVIVVACIVLGLGLVRYALSASGRSFGVAVATLRGPGQTDVIAIDGPARDVAAPPAQTLLIVPAGLLIAIPGLLTTAAGLVLWLPPIRARIAARIERAARRLGPPEGMPPPAWGSPP